MDYTFFAIRTRANPKTGRVLYVHAGTGIFQHLGHIPTLFSTGTICDEIIRDYEDLSHRAGRTPQELIIFPVTVSVDTGQDRELATAGQGEDPGKSR